MKTATQTEAQNFEAVIYEKAERWTFDHTVRAAAKRTRERNFARAVPASVLRDSGRRAGSRLGPSRSFVPSARTTESHRMKIAIKTSLLLKMLSDCSDRPELETLVLDDNGITDHYGGFTPWPVRPPAPSTPPQSGMAVAIRTHGNPSNYVAVPDLRVASRVVVEFLNSNGLGSAEWCGGEVYSDGKLVARISYNGRAWGIDSKSKKEIAL